MDCSFDTFFYIIFTLCPDALFEQAQYVPTDYITTVGCVTNITFHTLLFSEVNIYSTTCAILGYVQHAVYIDDHACCTINFQMSTKIDTWTLYDFMYNWNFILFCVKSTICSTHALKINCPLV